MKRLFPVILVLLIVAMSGCTGQNASSETEGYTFDRTNANLNGKMMDIEFLPTDIRAGEKMTANLVVGNTGSENIVRENIEIKVKPISLNDFLANIAILAMSESKKTVTFSNEYNEEIKPGMIKPLSYVFPTPKELKGKNLDGTYSVTIILSVNGQNVESKSVKMRLRSGKPRDGSITQANKPSGSASATSTPVATVASPAKTVTVASTPTPTPTPAPKAVTVDSYLFNWNDVPGSDNAKLVEYLKKKYNVDWVETANIEKSDDDMIINLTSGENLISFKLNDEKTIVSVIVDNVKNNELIGINENGKEKIYSGKLKFTRIKGWTFGEPNIIIDAGDWIQWQNLWDEENEYTLVEKNGIFSNITVRNRRLFLFNTTGTYTFQLFYPKMRVDPPLQVITVKLNQSQ